MKLVRLARVTALALLTGTAASGASAESLTSALASAYTNNPNILAQYISAEAKAEGIIGAKAGMLPRLSASGGVSTGASLAGGAWSTTNSANVGLTLSQNIYDGGATEAAIEIARAGTAAAIEAAAATEQSTLSSAAQTYIDVYINTQIVALRQDAVDYYQAQVQAADDRLSVGEGTQTEVAQAQAQLAQALFSQQSATASLAVASANYVQYIGHAPKSLSFSFPFEKLLPTSLEEAIKLAEANNPSLRSARTTIRLAKASADAAQAGAGPKVSISGSVSDTYTFAGGGANKASVGIGLNVTVPLYDGGTSGSAIRSANLGQIQSEVSAQASYDLITASITQAWSGLKTSAASIAAVKAAENATAKVLDAVTEEFGVGQKTQLDVLSAKSNLTDVQISRINAEASQFKAKLQLLAAIGRMSATDLGLPVEVRSADTYRAKVEDVWQNLRAIPN